MKEREKKLLWKTKIVEEGEREEKRENGN